MERGRRREKRRERCRQGPPPPAATTAALPDRQGRGTGEGGKGGRGELAARAPGRGNRKPEAAAARAATDGVGLGNMGDWVGSCLLLDPSQLAGTAWGRTVACSPPLSPVACLGHSTSEISPTLPPDLPVFSQYISRHQKEAGSLRTFLGTEEEKKLGEVSSAGSDVLHRPVSQVFGGRERPRRRTKSRHSLEPFPRTTMKH